MKQIVAGALALALSCVAAAVPPGETVLVAQLEMLRVDPQHAANWMTGVQSDQAGVSVVQSTELLFDSSVEAQIHLGRKYPIFYYDARPGVFQVNYVDTGVKLDIRCKQEESGLYTVDSLPEFSAVQRTARDGEGQAAASFPETLLVKSRSSLPHVALGTPVLVGQARGRNAERVLGQLGLDQPVQAGEAVVLRLTLRPARRSS